MIETTLATNFEPGTNLLGDMVSADWRFLLPELRHKEMLCLGVPRRASLKVIATLARQVVVVSVDDARMSAMRESCRQLRIENFVCLSVADYGHLEFGENCFSLVYLPRREETTAFLRRADLRRNIFALLSENGVVCYQECGFGDRTRSRALMREFERGGRGSSRSFWVTPFSGEMRTAIPVRQKDISKFFFRNVIFGQSWKKRLLSSIGHGLSSVGLIDTVAPRRSVFLQKSDNPAAAAAPPEFLCAMAGRAGIALETYRLGLSTRGKYNANKVIYFLFEKRSQQPIVIVKMTRAREFNYRLENEFKALSHLQAHSFVEPGSFPEPLFFDVHNSLALLAQKAVHGAPFRTRTDATPDCPLAQQALDWLIKLGKSSADRSLATGADVARGLGKLYHRFREVYQLSNQEDAFLTQQVAILASSTAGFPLVFQHGDPGTWNILVSPEGQIIFIDWEAGEPFGMPLWDIFYFMRTFASWVSRTQGSRDPMKNFSSNFLQPSPFVEKLRHTLPDYCKGIQLDTDLIEPLFYTCWMHRALKECCRLTTATLADGHYFNLLKRCIAERENETLQSLLLSNSDGQMQPEALASGLVQ